MARLGGMSTESFTSARECLSAASVGLAAILRDQKTMPGSSRSHILLGLSLQTTPAATRSLSNSPACSRANSPIESSGFLDADDADDHKEEDICGVDLRESRNSQLLKESLGVSHSVSYAFNDVRNHGYDPTLLRGFSRAHTHPQTHAHTHQQRHSRTFHDVPRQQMYAAEGTRPARHHLAEKGAGLSDSIVTSTASVRLSPLSKVSETPAQPAMSTPSWTIRNAKRHTLLDATRDSDHQSAPLNVPNWSKMCKTTASGATSSHSISKFGEGDSERLPPHELLAREYAQSQRMTSSVCEGHGRTLKGRDMRRVRNAVWRQSGFAD